MADPSVPPPVDTAEAARLLAEAEGWWVYWEYSGSLTDVGTAEERAAARVLHTEYDRRGAALDAARVELADADEIYEKDTDALASDVVDLQDEVIRLRAQRAAVLAVCDVWAGSHQHEVARVAAEVREALGVTGDGA